ncbi:hypothetical protein [Calothrix sp. 336/3]|uniref:hypothetical protein n=1 Tax=Calothrix sp. 336/3 TaxID=1337936 RepID=UPI0004E2E62E|nr:hypothetical protein [Calothrix sp. 336/3]AKG21980.1 hypothetical protein IJ00_12560 [Calothrix sp. 336/3]
MATTICDDCIFHSLTTDGIECTNPEESPVNCSVVIFCNSFQPKQEVDSPCVSYGIDENVDSK